VVAATEPTEKAYPPTLNATDLMRTPTATDVKRTELDPPTEPDFTPLPVDAGPAPASEFEGKRDVAIALGVTLPPEPIAGPLGEGDTLPVELGDVAASGAQADLEQKAAEAETAKVPTVEQSAERSAAQGRDVGFAWHGTEGDASMPPSVRPVAPVEGPWRKISLLLLWIVALAAAGVAVGLFWI
jgi:hypothetical protein